LYREAKAMLRGILEIEKGTVIKSKDELEEVRKMFECANCGCWITSKKVMQGHMIECGVRL
jgi:hypothetical protein